MSGGDRLCQKCEALRFNDLEHGGTLNCTDDEGNPIWHLFDPWDDYSDDDPFDPKVVFEVPYHRSDSLPHLPDFSTSGSAGCGFCDLLGSFISKAFEQDLERIRLRANEADDSWKVVTETLQFHLRRPGIFDEMCVKVKYENLSGENWHEYACFTIHANAGPCAQWLRIQRRPLLPIALSEEGSSLINTWVRGCIEGCHPPSQPARIPTRLIDVGGRDDVPEPRLAITAQHVPQGSDLNEWGYVALSHCWGDPGKPPLKTTTVSLGDRMNEIPMSTLPANYREAIRVTRCLGIKYIWIDSLCIIQDDKADWEGESTRMSEVYQNALVTICALWGSSCHDGLNLERNPRNQVEVTFASSVNDNIEGTYYIGNHDKDRWLLWTELRNTVWTRRGWTLQEDLFSKRKLYFGSMMFYACDKRLSAETAGDLKQRLPGGSFKLLPELCSEYGEHGTIVRSWDSICEYYSGRALTYHTDRFPAISSLAKLAGVLTGDQYLAGLWKRNLRQSLLWVVDCPQLNFCTTIDRLCCTDNYIAPSWSWARSMEGSYTLWDWKDGKGPFEVREAATVPLHSDEFGRLKDGHLLLSGKLHGFIDKKISEEKRGDRVFWWSGGQVASGLSARYHLDWEERESPGDSCLEISDERLAHIMMFVVSTGKSLSGLLLYPTGRTSEYWRIGIFFLERTKKEVEEDDEEEDEETRARKEEQQQQWWTTYLDDWRTCTVRIV